jgi:hypothetical protein
MPSLRQNGERAARVTRRSLDSDIDLAGVFEDGGVLREAEERDF